MHEFIFILEVEEKRVVYEIEFCGFSDIDFELFNWLEEFCEEFTVEFFEWKSNF